MADIPVETDQNDSLQLIAEQNEQNLVQITVEKEQNQNESTLNDKRADPKASINKALVWQKKPRYNGRHKKRQWENTDRNRRDDACDEKRVCIKPEERIKRRKFCMLMGYAGANYFGMQRNPHVNTIEEELLKALLKNKLITDEGFNQPQTIHFQRAARTDKGVSAARQCCSMKLRK